MPFFVFILVFWILTLFQNNTACIDEFYYIAKTFSWGHLLNILKDEGKTPFPLWMVRPFVHFLGFKIEIARLATIFAGAASASILYRIIKSDRRSYLPALWFLFTSAFFVFYSRIFMYEIFLVWACFLCLWGIRALFDPRLHNKAKHALFWGFFIGAMTKRNFFAFTLGFPLVLWIEHLRVQELFPNYSQKTNLKTVFTQTFAALLFFIAILSFSSTWNSYLYFGEKVGVTDASSALSRLDFDLRAFEVLQINIGDGVLLGCFLAVIILLFQGKWLVTFLHCVLFLTVFITTSSLSNKFMARYLICLFPLMIYQLYSFLSFIRGPQLKKFVLTCAMIGQLYPFFQTTLPLLRDIKSLRRWTEDEISQHINQYAPGFGYFEQQTRLLELGNSFKITLTCEGDFAFTLCDYFPIFYPKIFNGSRPELKLHYLKTQNNLLPTLTDGQEILFSFDQAIPAASHFGSVYLIKK